MKKLTLGSFKRHGAPGSFKHYFSHFLEDGTEICLEACMQGYDVAIYDPMKKVIGEKECTEIDGMMEMQIAPGFSLGTGEALEKAVTIANKKLKIYLKQKGEEKK